MQQIEGIYIHKIIEHIRIISHLISISMEISIISPQQICTLSYAHVTLYHQAA